jgi:hypothetical protein
VLGLTSSPTFVPRPVAVAAGLARLPGGCEGA